MATLSELSKNDARGINDQMKELANSLAQLAFIIMLLVTLAIWTAAASQWLSGPDAATHAVGQQATFSSAAQ